MAVHGQYCTPTVWFTTATLDAGIGDCIDQRSRFGIQKFNTMHGTAASGWDYMHVRFKFPYRR